METGLAERYARDLQHSFDFWDYYRRGDTSDPNNSDGYWMNRARQDIIYYKGLISDRLNLDEYPLIYFRSTPPIVAESFMAQPEAIRSAALRALSEYRADENYLYILRCSDWMSREQMKACNVAGTLAYVSELDKAVEADDLVGMRRYSRTSTFTWLFEYHAKQVRKLNPPEQLDLFTAPDLEHDGGELEL